MSLPEVTSRAEWLAARKELLVKEKQWTRQRDEIDRRLEVLVAHLHQLGRILRCRQRLGHHQHHRLAHMHDALARERRPVRDDELAAAAAGEGRMASDIADAGRLHVGGRQDKQHAQHFRAADVAACSGARAPLLASIAIILFSHMVPGATHMLRIASYSPFSTVA